MFSLRMTVKMRTSKKHPVHTKRATVSMVFVTPWNLLLVRLLACISSSEIQIINFAYLSTGHPILTWARMWRFSVIVRNQKGSASKIMGSTDIDHHRHRGGFFNRCFSEHFDKYRTIFANKCTVYWNIKCYNLYLKYLFIWLLHFSIPHGPSSGSIRLESC